MMETLKCKDLKPHTKKGAVEVQVLSREEARNVRARKDRISHAMSEALVGDETGTILMTLWDDDVQRVDNGKTYFISNVYVTLFRGSIRLNIGKYADVKEIEKKFEVDLKNNMSEKVHEQPRRPSEYDRFSSGSFWPEH
ncbi:MAG: single-stranded DNA-binding protein [Candidatus Altiarchaeota archaeon]|nr:single-stranded DNA-binding protein [Candidatus Altiarchaeota archaeon]